jgi:hypothetical protein
LENTVNTTLDEFNLHISLKMIFIFHGVVVGELTSISS